MNNIQQTRIQLEKTYLSMGGEKLEEDAAGILTQLQSTLTRDLDHLALQFSQRCFCCLFETLISLLFNVTCFNEI